MLSISSRGSAGEAVNYYTHMRDERGRADEYYASEGGGQWFGAGAAALGLIGEVKADMFVMAAEGRSPSGQDLVQGAGSAHRAGWDATFSAPKSVSVLWGLADVTRRMEIQRTHDHAVESALSHIEQEFSLARRGKGGREYESAKLLIGLFRHGTSREQDPQLHTHAFLHNLAMRQDGTWGGIDPLELYRWKMALGAIYRAELAAGMAELGYQVAADGDSFKVCGVPDDVCRYFSKRREQIEAALSEVGMEGSAKASELAALSTRVSKAKDLDAELLHARWQEEASEMGFSADQTLTAKVEPKDIGPMPNPEELLTKATALDAVIESRHIWRTVAVAAQHRGLQLDTIREHVDLVMRSSEILRMVHPETGAVRYTSRALYRQERKIITAAEARSAETHHVVPSALVDSALDRFAAEKGFALSTEQQAAVRYATQSDGAFRVIVGDAGAGKSTAMLAARMAWESNSQRVLGCAISGKAAAGLQEGSGIKSRTIAGLLIALEPSVNEDTDEVHPPREVLSSTDVLVIDEAGMVDSRTMHRIMQHAAIAGCRVVMVGDHKQLQAVSAGGVFRHLAERDSARISEIRRQKAEWAKVAVEEFSRGEAAAAITKFLDRDLVYVEDDQRAAIDRTVDRWVHHSAVVGESETLLMASTNVEVQALNQAARARMSAEHKLTNEVVIQVRDREGRPAGRLQVAEGDRLLAKKNDRATGLKNGDLVTVDRINYTQEGLRILVRLDRTGERVAIDPAEYSQLRHGYAVTTYAAQGATVDRVVALAGGSMTSRESIYVQMSRMRQTAEIIATRQQLRDAAEQLPPTEKMRGLAQTIAAEQFVELPPECDDSFAACRAWLDQHACNVLGIDGRPASDPRLAEMRDLVSAMSASRQKETTLDYVVEQSGLEEAQAMSGSEQQDMVAQAMQEQEDEIVMTMEDW
ncbi:MobF family relaxase [Acidihalobacter prosperus]|uniref:Conjugative relaxase n=1 Tax=Acidihalobacter prosperus TaxID=160660 RepID=A0A1A6C104_9GAMM|nr:MobF family relaxase [Acidihalobacter prosperus]OBS08233.1 conjugative relaxase [Acidihalobacter prosperus]